MTEPILPNRHIVTDSQPAAVRLFASLFGDRLFSPRLKFAVTAILACLLSYVLLAQNPWWIFGLFGRPSTPAVCGGDKLYHFIGYFGLALVFLWYSTSKSLRFAMILVGTAAIHGGSTELLQQFVPGRVADLSDFWMNLFGIAAGSAVGLTLRKLARGQSDNSDSLGIHAGDRSQLANVTQRKSSSSNSPDPVTFSREAMTGEQIAEVKSRVVNFRFLGIFASMMLILFGSAYALHGWQIRRNARDLRELGAKARDAGELDRARRLYSQYVGLVPEDVNALADYGVILDESKLSPEAGRHAFMVYENVLRTDPAREDIRRRQIQVAIGLRRFPDALAHVEILRQTHPTDGELSFLAGLCHEEQLDHQKAAEAYAAAVEQSPERIEAWSRLANLLQRSLDQPAKAEEIINRLVEDNPADAAAWLARANFRKQLGRIEEASADLEQATQRDPGSERILLAAAEIGYEKARLARTAGKDAQVERTAIETRRLIEKSLELFPENLDLRLRLVVLEAHFGDADKAMTLLEEILTAVPGESQSQILLADLTIAQGDFERARQAVAALPRTPGTDAMRLFLEGRIAMAAGEWTKAKDILVEARRFLPNTNAMAERTDLALAQCYGQLELIEDETRTYRRVLKYRSESIPARLGLAATHLKADRLEDAIAEYQPLSHLPQVRLALARLMIIQNLRMPDVARNWRPVVTLLDQAREHGDDAVAETLLRAEVLAARKKYDEAKALIQSAQASQTDHVEFRLALSRIADRTGDRQRAALWLGQALAAAGSDEAEQKLVEAVEADATDAEASQTLMRFYLARDRREDALAEFRRLAPQMTRFQLAETYALFGDLGRATELLRQERNAKPKNARTLEALAEVLIAGDLKLEAEAVLRESTRLADKENQQAVQTARRRLAVLLSSSGQFENFTEALSLLDENDDANGSPIPQDTRARASVLATRTTAAERATATRLLESLNDRNLMTAADRWLLGRLYQSAGQTEKATGQFERALKDAPDAGVLIGSYVETLIDRGELEAAAEWLTRLRKTDADNATRLQVMIDVLQGDGASAEKRVKSFSRARPNSETNPALRLVEAAQLADDVAAWSRGRKSKEASAAAPVTLETASLDESARRLEVLAESLLRDAVSREPATVHSLVVFLMQSGRDEQIAALIEPVWKNLPAETAAGLSLAMLGSSETARKKIGYVEEKLLAEIEASKSDERRGTPAQLLLQLCLADLRSLSGDDRQAEQLYRTLLQIDRRMVPAMNNLAWLLARRGSDLEEASLLINRAMKIAGPIPELLDTRGCVCLALGQNRQAVEFLSQATRESASPSTLLHLAEAQQAGGEKSAAQKTLKKAIVTGLQRGRLHPLDQEVLDRLSDGGSSSSPR